MIPEESDNPYRAPARELTSTPIAPVQEHERSTVGSRLVRHYYRLVGGLQILYGLIFGWGAIAEARFLIEFGLDLANQHILFAIVVGPACAILAMVSFLAGTSTIRQHRRCRGWQLVYLAAYASFLVAGMIHDWINRGKALDGIETTISLSIPLILPYVPIVFLRNSPGWSWGISFHATNSERQRGSQAGIHL